MSKQMGVRINNQLRIDAVRLILIISRLLRYLLLEILGNQSEITSAKENRKIRLEVVCFCPGITIAVEDLNEIP